METGRTQPMTDFHKRVLKRARAEIVADMIPQNVLSRLISDEILEIEERQKVLGGNGPSEQNESLMDIIHRKPDRAYDCFKKALKRVGQQHVADILETKEAQLQTELQSEHAFGNGLTSAVHNYTKTITSLALPGPGEQVPAKESTSNETRVVTILAKGKVITSLQKTSTNKLPGNQQLAICEDPESKSTKDGIENAVALPGSNENDDDGLTKKLEERRRRKRAESREGNRQPQTGEGGCTVGVKLSVGEVRTGGNQPGSKELLQEVANYIWRTLNHVVRKLKCDNASEGVSPQDQTGIYEFLMSFNSQHCKVTHVGVEPVLFVVQCMNLESLETITTLDDNDTFANLLEKAVLKGTLAQQHRIIDVTLVTHISKQEIKLCKRVLGNLETLLKVVVQTTPERSSQIEYELYKEVETRELQGGSEISTAMRAIVTKVEPSSILLTLQFQSLDNLKAFRKDLDSGQLTRLIEDVLITDDIKKKYDLDNLGLSVTLVDPWEYEMCEIELSLIDGRKEDLAEDNLDETIQLDVETVEQDCCHHFRLDAERLAEEVRRLSELNKNLLEKVEKLDPKETKVEKDYWHHFDLEVERLSEKLRQLKETLETSEKVEKDYFHHFDLKGETLLEKFRRLKEKLEKTKKVEQEYLHHFDLKEKRLPESLSRLIEELEENEQVEQDCCHHFNLERERLLEELRRLEEKVEEDRKVEQDFSHHIRLLAEIFSEGHGRQLEETEKTKKVQQEYSHHFHMECERLSEKHRRLREKWEKIEKVQQEYFHHLHLKKERISEKCCLFKEEFEKYEKVQQEYFHHFDQEEERPTEKLRRLKEELKKVEKVRKIEKPESKEAKEQAEVLGGAYNTLIID